MYPFLPNAISEKIKEELKNREIEKRWRLLRWYSTVAFAQLLISSRGESFRLPHAAALGKRGAILRRLYEKAQEREQDVQVACEFEQERARKESVAERFRNQHLERLKRFGLPEETSEAGLREYLEVVRRKLEESKAASEQERAVLDRLREDAGDDLEQKIAALQHYCAANPESDLGYSCLIGAYRETRRFDEAIRLATREIERAEIADPTPSGQPRRSSGKSTLIMKQSVGRLLLEKGAAEESAKFLERSIAEEEEKEYEPLRQALLPLMYVALGDAYRQMGETSRAKKIWKKALHKTPPQRWDDMSDNIVECEVQERLKEVSSLEN
jgi:tetratricopeptide (TPR) repeat protein